MAQQGRLKNLEFAKVDVQILNIGNQSRIRISWELKPTKQILKDLKFFIDRGESPTELKQLNATPIPANTLYEFLDLTAHLLDTEKVYYYRVRAVEFFQGTAVQTFTAPVATWEGLPDLVALYIIEEHIFKHQYVSGTPILIYKKVKEGARCTNCWDTVLKRQTISNCTECHGTGFAGGTEGGFYSPLPAWMDFNPDPKQSQIAEFGARQPRQTDVEYTNYPLLVPNDLIIELSTNRYWRVSNSRTTEKNRVTTLQFCRLDEINRSDIEMTIKVPDALRKSMLAELEVRDNTPEF